MQPPLHAGVESPAVAPYVPPRHVIEVADPPVQYEPTTQLMQDAVGSMLPAGHHVPPAHAQPPAQLLLEYTAAPADVPHAPAAHSAGVADLGAHQPPAAPHTAGGEPPPAHTNPPGQGTPPLLTPPAMHAYPGAAAHWPLQPGPAAPAPLPYVPLGHGTGEALPPTQ